MGESEILSDNDRKMSREEKSTQEIINIQFQCLAMKTHVSDVIVID